MYEGRAALILRGVIVRETIEPTLARFAGSNHGMMRRSCMFAGMLIRRAVTTTRTAAFLAGPQVHPLRANLHALLALSTFRMFYRCDGPNMFASGVGHCSSFSLMIHTRKASGNRIRVGAGGGSRDNNAFHSGVDDCEKTNTLSDLVAH